MDFDYPFANLPSELVEPLPPGGQDELLIVSGLQLPPDRVILRVWLLKHPPSLPSPPETETSCLQEGRQRGEILMPALGQRKEPEIPVEKIKQLASIGCTDEEISLIAGISEATLQTRYHALLKEGRAAFKAEIRGMQRRRCLDGSDTMLIWLVR